ncbi:MAG: hypothetical protein SH857_03720 [Chitinophagales bacterium]|nr:hypothetical protein [Chitinophagales bacterium]
MTRESLIKRTLTTLEKLPQEKVSEVADYVEFIFKKYEEEILQKGIEKIVSESKTFSYLKDEEDLYTVNELKEKYK